MMRKLINSFIFATLVTLNAGCPSERNYSAEDARLAKVRAAQEKAARTEEHQVGQWPSKLRDHGAEGAKAKIAKVFGIEDTAARRVFAFDSSGSMASVFGDLRMRLNQAIAALDSQSAFLIVFFTHEGSASPSDQWLMADATGKRQAMDFMEKIQPYAATDPIPGIQQAFALNPEVIYLGTDGDFPNNAQVKETIEKLNVNHKVKVNTIIFGDGNAEINDVLKQIAGENGGRFVRVDL
jgi:hypothetical protein